MDKSSPGRQSGVGELGNDRPALKRETKGRGVDEGLQGVGSIRRRGHLYILSRTETQGGWLLQEGRLIHSAGKCLTWARGGRAAVRRH